MVFHLTFGELERYSSCSRCPRLVGNGGRCLGLLDKAYPGACFMRKEYLRTLCRG